uniref:Uncharacterized protein n=1 Tax=Anguilla anguilla TaxID=7936 RepID=A0A0E9SJ84_ANGAN
MTPHLFIWVRFILCLSLCFSYSSKPILWDGFTTLDQNWSEVTGILPRVSFIWHSC